VARSETREQCPIGNPVEKIVVSGIPIDPVFSEPKDQIEMRRKHGLKPDLTTIVLSAGGFGSDSIESILNSLLELQHEAQVVAICGRNEELREKLNSLVSCYPLKTRVEVKVVGYTTAMDEYMSAADLMLGKPGGLTTSEALAKGLVFVIVNPIPGQEERNADHLLDGVALRYNNLRTGLEIDRCWTTQRLAETMRQECSEARPEAASEIAPESC
jgi:processive 1,2-diacylglycerol beta-glucosyltransferase